jgi:hydroxymethylpyrimidine pyrophosphatase-like HAD family hydrolase
LGPFFSMCQRIATHEHNLIVLDLDGTCLKDGEDSSFDETLGRYLENRSMSGDQWIINTDRRLSDVIPTLNCLSDDHGPAAILTMQRYIFVRAADASFVPCNPWNLEQEKTQRAFRERMREPFNAWRKLAVEPPRALAYVHDDEVFSFCVTPEDRDRFLSDMRNFFDNLRDVNVTSSGEWVYAMFSGFSKKCVLSGLMSLTHWSYENVIAVGDGANDISLLDGTVTRRVGCPADACRDVLDVVRQVGGHVARAVGAKGTLQVLKHFLS